MPWRHWKNDGKPFNAEAQRLMRAAEKWEVPPVATGGCFIAGTLVHTDKGLVPIEQIKVGDRVLSQPEQTREKAYKKVVNTFEFEDKAIWVVKYMLIDGDVPYDHPDYMPRDRNIYHCYATGNHPFWVEGEGWTAAEKIKQYQILELANGQRAEVRFGRPVIRSTQPGFGRVWSNQFADGQEVHIVDFRNGSNLWKYRWNRENEASAPYQDGYPLDEIVEIGRIHCSDDPFFKTKVYNLEVEGFHTYYVGELGVWVHDLDCGQFQRQSVIKGNAKCL